MLLCSCFYLLSFPNESFIWRNTNLSTFSNTAFPFTPHHKPGGHPGRSLTTHFQSPRPLFHHHRCFHMSPFTIVGQAPLDLRASIPQVRALKPAVHLPASLPWAPHYFTCWDSDRVGKKTDNVLSLPVLCCMITGYSQS